MELIIVMKKKDRWKKEPDYATDKEIKYIIRYVISRKNTDEKVRFWGTRGLSMDLDKMVVQMIAIQKLFGKKKGRRVYHMIISFPSKIRNMTLVRSVAEGVANYLFEDYQVVYGIHEDTDDIHIHFVFNAVSYWDGKKYHKNKKEFGEMKEDIRKIVKECERV